jgi:hypothetical protein
VPQPTRVENHSQTSFIAFRGPQAHPQPVAKLVPDTPPTSLASLGLLTASPSSGTPSSPSDSTSGHESRRPTATQVAARRPLATVVPDDPATNIPRFARSLETAFDVPGRAESSRTRQITRICCRSIGRHREVIRVTAPKAQNADHGVLRHVTALHGRRAGPGQVTGLRFQPRPLSCETRPQRHPASQ